MRKIAHNRQNFTVKKRNFFVFDRIWLTFKLDLKIVESKFPIDFQGRSQKKSKVTFFTRFQYFCDALYYDFLFANNIVILIKI